MPKPWTSKSLFSVILLHKEKPSCCKSNKFHNIINFLSANIEFKLSEPAWSDYYVSLIKRRNRCEEKDLVKLQVVQSATLIYKYIYIYIHPQ